MTMIISILIYDAIDCAGQDARSSRSVTRNGPQPGVPGDVVSITVNDGLGLPTSVTSASQDVTVQPDQA
jgi:hypothetical protein